MDSVDYKYANILSTRLQKFKIKNHSPYRANFRCYVCGDSEQSKTKARGWILDQDNKAFYYCFNCFYSKPIGIFLRNYFPALYNDYIIDKKLDIKNKTTPLDTLTTKQPKFLSTTSPLKSQYIQKLSSLKSWHFAKKYVEQRMIPSNQHYKIWYTPKFKKWVNSLIPDKLKGKDEPRLIFPFIDKNDKVVGFTGRSLNKFSMRYITIMLDSNASKIFNYNEVDITKQYFITEGPIDSLFLPNAIAMAGADIKIVDKPNNAVYIFDNEPRNKQIIQRMNKLINDGCNIVIWPSHIKEKDINDMVLAGYDPMPLIRPNIYMGLNAELKLREWSKVRYE